jgi:hypothetical protein
VQGDITAFMLLFFCCALTLLREVDALISLNKYIITRTNVCVNKEITLVGLKKLLLYENKRSAEKIWSREMEYE